MKNKKTIYLFLALVCVWFPVFVGFRYSQQIRNILPSIFVQVWDKDKPASSTSLRNSNPEMLANQAALESAIAQDHEFSTGGTNSGKHEVITFEEEASAGASSTDEGHLQIIDGGSQPEMAFTSEDGDELQFTKDGDLFSSDGLVVTEASTFNGSINLGAGDDLLLSTTSDITISGNTFTVAGATGNTVVAGTLSVTGVATIGDASTLATSAAPTADAEIANKLYVDNAVQIVNITDGAVNTGTTAVVDDDNITQNTEGDEYMTLAITPVNASHFLKIQVTVNFAHTSAAVFVIALFQDSTANALAVISPAIAGTNVLHTATFTHYMVAGTTSETTFKVRAGSTAGATTTFNGVSSARKQGGVLSSNITITELRG